MILNSTLNEFAGIIRKWNAEKEEGLYLILISSQFA